MCDGRLRANKGRVTEIQEAIARALEAVGARTPSSKIEVMAGS